MGCRAAGADVTQQAATYSARRRRAGPAQRTRRAQAAVHDLLPVGLVRRRPDAVLEMKRILILAGVVWMAAAASTLLTAAEQSAKPAAASNPHLNLDLFTHSDNCIACHNNLASSSGEDVSIGTMWRATMMANSARDPYWQASVRRETLDHPI